MNREQALAEALRDLSRPVDKDGKHVVEGGEPCWCEMPYMIPYRGHDAGCEAARAALSEKGEGERPSWQCFGCRWGFQGDWQKVCPACGRTGYWTGSVEPGAKLWRAGVPASPPHPAEGEPSPQPREVCSKCGQYKGAMRLRATFAPGLANNPGGWAPPWKPTCKACGYEILPGRAPGGEGGGR